MKSYKSHISSQLSLTFLFLLISTTCASPKPPVLSKHPVLLVVSFDGFRADYLNKTATPHLTKLREEGVRVPYMQAQFPTKTFPNHQSMATGLIPDIHGITDNTLYDPDHGFLSGFSDDPEFWNFDKEVLPFWLRNEQAGDGRYSGCFMWSGSSTGYGPNFTLFPTYYAPRYDESILWESRVDTVISWITDETKPANLVFLYHNEPDSHGHSFGTDDDETLAEIRRTDDRAGYLIQGLTKAGIYDRINLMIVSDHGMITIRNDSVINTTSIADRSRYTRYGGSPVYHLRPNYTEDLDTIYEAFRSASLISQNFKAYKKDGLHAKFGYGLNRRVMDIVLVAEPGHVYEDFRFNQNGEGGTHGYDNEDESMWAVFIARGPHFKKQFNLESPIKNLDLVPLFSKLMGVPEPPNNGSLDVIGEILEENLDGAHGSSMKPAGSFVSCLSLFFLASLFS